jgi:hypothetical protein
LRARPEPTQLECLSDASFLGKLLVLPTNVRLDWKAIARYKQSNVFSLFISDKEKGFQLASGVWMKTQLPVMRSTRTQPTKFENRRNQQY